MITKLSHEITDLWFAYGVSVARAGTYRRDGFHAFDDMQGNLLRFFYGGDPGKPKRLIITGADWTFFRDPKNGWVVEGDYDAFQRLCALRMLLAQ